jgi:sterol 3beta-glucosyltransferase
MRISILAAGTRGDVQPYLALALGLKRAGHGVLLATDASFEGMAREYGLDFLPLPIDIRAALETGQGLEMLDRGQNPLSLARGMARHMRDMVRQAMPGCIQACEGAELLVLGGPTVFLGYSIAERMGVPFAIAQMQPLMRTRAFASPVVPPLPVSLGAPFNLFTHFVTEMAFWQLFRPAIDVARTEFLGLPPAGFQPLLKTWRQQCIPTLLGFSPALVPSAPDYHEATHLTGYWFLDAPGAWQPPQALVDFLEAGPPPVYVGFGSMSSRDPRGTTELVLEALERSGQRGILLTGWGGLGRRELPDTVLQVDSVPHDWLFPRVSAVVHHGGAGTTAAGLRAGRASVVIPFFADQPFWGWCVERAGVGPRPIHRKHLTAKRLAEALTAATQDSGIRERAMAMGQRFRSEDGVARAVEALERHFLRRVA